ncbi:hypothetical protein [Alkalibacillus haloalkaliphilus]|uniref:hypothetical protein n=1 Tax=Alkalibacillus haloalkaliphilus TaxID=94136 RepID=UPI0029365843|nr:hypothetical protein [Alkalibacillus haloalkaliphilus]MDV2582366.1 hypothetical protein [Alkalibacillus haloalkaliphilus]
MEVVINSPLQPTLFKQRIKVNGEYGGYLSAKRFFQIAVGKYSFKSKFGNSVVSMEEQKKHQSKRNWVIKLMNHNKELENCGSMIMVSSINDTLRVHATSFDITFKEYKYYVKKPYMQWGRKKHSYIIVMIY